MSGYSIEHPVYRHVNMRVQTAPGSGCGGEQALSETLDLAQELFKAVGGAMEAQMAGWPAKKAAADARLAAAAAAARAREAERAAKMARWVAMVQEKAEPWDRALEVELWGKVVSTDLERASARGL
jgi:RNA-splicing ligase RtcB